MWDTVYEVEGYINKKYRLSRRKGDKYLKEFNTPYDDVYRTMLQECRTLIIPVINEIFKNDYTRKETINMEENEIIMFCQEKTDKRITDSSFSIESKSKKKYYHLECQSTINGKMAVRMYEYDSQIALKHYSIEEIFDKHLFLLIPFYFFVFEDSLLEIENNETKLIQLKKEYSNIMKRLEELNNNGIIDVYKMVLEQRNI